MKYFEDANGFVYKRGNENEVTVYLECLNAPRCLAAARFYKKVKEFRLFGNHAAETCPPDARMKTKIHFEEFLKKAVVVKENEAVSVLNVYKRTIENRYIGIWLPQDHRQTFLAILRRIRKNQKTNGAKPNKSKRNAIEMCDAASSPIKNFSPAQVGSPMASTSNDLQVATQSHYVNENVCIFIFAILNRTFSNRFLFEIVLSSTDSACYRR